MDTHGDVIGAIDHLGWVVRSLTEAQPVYERLYDLTEVARLSTPVVEVVMLQSGTATFELLSPVGEDSEFAGFLTRNGEGLHHIAYVVPDIEHAMRVAGERGMRLLDVAPRPGARNTMVAFADSGLEGAPLVQFVQRS